MPTVPSCTVIREHQSIPTGFDSLLSSCCNEGYGFLRRLKEQWNRSENRFDEPGECLIGAWSGSDLIGIGGLNIDPYIANETSVGRLRHLYVAVGYRRNGVGHLLVSRLMHEAKLGFRVVRLRVADENGSRFYESLGFERINEQYASHRFYFGEDQ